MNWLDHATPREAQRVATLQRNKADANAELQKIRDRCWKRMKRERETLRETQPANPQKS